MGVASLWLGVWQLLLLCIVWAGQLVRGAEHVCSPGRLPQIIRIGKFHAWLLMIGGMLCAPSCYWLVGMGHVVRGKEHVCSPGRLPQIIRIGKFHARLLVIGGMLCAPSCYWLAWVGHVSCIAAYDWWDVFCAILLLAGVGAVCFIQGCL